MRFLIALLTLTATLRAADYPVAFLSHQRTSGYFATQSVSERGGPYIYHSDTNLVIANPDGTESVVVDGNVLDFSVSLDAKSIIYSQVHDGYCDLYRTVIETGEVTQLTDAQNDWRELPASVRWDASGNYNVPPKVWNMSPCEVGGGSIVFTSNRDCVSSPHEGYSAQQLFRMDSNGKNVHKIGYLNLGGAGHPTLSPSGRIYWSSGEQQGNRLGLGSSWSIWSSNSDGSAWNPELSSIPTETFRSFPWHFQTHTSDGSLVVGMYYDTRSPHGAIHVAPKFEVDPFGPPTKFHSPIITDNPWIWDNKDSSTTRTITNPPSGQRFRGSYMRRGMYSLAPWATMRDAENTDSSGSFPGMISQPNACPNNGVIVTWTGDEGDEAMNLGLYEIADVKTPSDTPSDMNVVVDEENRHEWGGKPVVPFSAIYGIEKVPSPSYPKSNLLEPASPFAEVSTSSMAWTELVNRDGTTLKDVTVEDVAYIRIVAFNPTLKFKSQDFHRYDNGHENRPKISNYEGFSSSINERMGYYSRLIPLKKYRNTDGSIHYGPNPPQDATPILDPEGKPDTSFKAIIPADQPWSFQALNSKGEAVVTAETWHQLRPGEQRTCGGCHTHWQRVPFSFEDSFAATTEYTVPKLDKIEVVEYYRDIQEIDERLELNLGERPWVNGPWAFSSDTWDVDDDNRLTDVEAKLLRSWNDTGFMAAGTYYKFPDSVEGSRISPESGWGPYADGVAPTLVVKLYSDEIKIGACDPQSGLDSLSVVADFEFSGKAAGEELSPLFSFDDSIYSASGDVPESGTVTVILSDKRGNEARRALNFDSTEPMPDSCDEEIEQLNQRITELEQQVQEKSAKLEEFWIWLDNQPTR